MDFIANDLLMTYFANLIFAFNILVSATFNGKGLTFSCQHGFKSIVGVA